MRDLFWVVLVLLLVVYSPAQTPVYTQQSISMLQHRDIFTVPDEASAPSQSFALERSITEGTEEVYLNGILMAPNVDYSIMGSSLQFLPVQPVGPGAIVQVRYWASR